MASKMILHSNFRKVIDAAHDGLGDAVEKWKDEGEDQTKNTMTRQESRRGYNFNDAYDSIKSERLGDTNAAFGVDVWWWRFFEFGTVFIAPTPVVRPAKRKADAAFKREAGTSVERAIRRRASV